MKKFLLLCCLCLALCACQAEISPSCTEGDLTYQKRDIPFPAAEPGGEPASPLSIEINGKTLQVDQVIHGPLCNQTLSGTVYIACDIQIYEWQETQNFLDGCEFNVAPGTVIYVAAHNNTAYYNGCASCHVSGGKGTP